MSVERWTDVSGEILITLGDGSVIEATVEDRIRIAACVNVCAGIPTKAITRSSPLREKKTLIELHEVRENLELLISAAVDATLVLSNKTDDAQSVETYDKLTSAVSKALA